MCKQAIYIFFILSILYLFLHLHLFNHNYYKCRDMCNAKILKFKYTHYNMPKKLVETSMVEQFGVHHIGHKLYMILGRQWK